MMSKEEALKIKQDAIARFFVGEGLMALVPGEFRHSFTDGLPNTTACDNGIHCSVYF